MMGTNDSAFDEHLDAAVEAENKGDRYRSGPKAKRFYESACHLYSKANFERPGIPEVLYNWARIEFVLAEMKDPEPLGEEKRRLLESAIQKFKMVCQAESWNADALFNLAQVIHANVSLTIDTGEPIASWEEDLLESLRFLDRCLEIGTRFASEMANTGSPDNQETEQTLENDMESSKVDPWEISALKVDIIVTAMETWGHLEKIGEYFNQAKTVLDQVKNSSLTNSQVIEYHLKMASIHHTLGFKIFELANQLDHNVFQEALQHLDIILAQDPGYVEALCDKGDTLISFAEAQNSLEKSRPLFASASDCFTRALESEPLNPSILLKLGDINLTRIRLYPGESLQKTRQILGKNAKLYYERCYPSNKHGPERKWILYHLLKANSYIPENQQECLRIWTALMPEGMHFPWESEDDIPGLLFGPYFTPPSIL